MSKTKRKQINIEEKSRIISKLKSGIPNKDLAEEYGVSHSTISSIWKEREKIQTLYDRNFLKMKRARTSKHTKIEEALLKWFKCQSTKNVSVNGPTLQKKANDLAHSFGEDFVCSSSWIQRFRVRHGIVGGKMSVEAATVDNSVVVNADEEELQPALSTSEAEDVIDNSFATCALVTEHDVQELKTDNDGQEETEEQLRAIMGRKQTNAVHGFYIYDKEKNKSKCLVPGCAMEVTGNHATNLVFHLSSKHAEVYKIVQTRNRHMPLNDNTSVREIQEAVSSLQDDIQENDSDSSGRVVYSSQPRKFIRIHQNRRNTIEAQKKYRLVKVRPNVMERRSNFISNFPKTDDEFYYFALSIAAQLRKLPTNVAMNAQTRIQSILSLARVKSCMSRTNIVQKNPLSESQDEEESSEHQEISDEDDRFLEMNDGNSGEKEKLQRKGNLGKNQLFKVLANSKGQGWDPLCVFSTLEVICTLGDELQLIVN